MDQSGAWQAIKDLSKEEFEKRIKPQRLPDDRKDLLFKFIQGDIQVCYSCRPDIEAYALKCLMPEFYNSNPIEGHPYSSCDIYEYDPPKNGQNIIKHGIGFGEVVSYSRKFGRLLVPIPNETDGERLVIFSGLDLKREGDELEIPPPDIRDMNYVISIVNCKEGKFRFISARLLSSKKKKYEKTIAQALGKIITNKQARQGFINDCVETLERDLIQSISPSSQGNAPPVSPPAATTPVVEGAESSEVAAPTLP